MEVIGPDLAPGLIAILEAEGARRWVLAGGLLQWASPSRPLGSKLLAPPCLNWFFWSSSCLAGFPSLRLWMSNVVWQWFPQTYPGVGLWSLWSPTIGPVCVFIHLFFFASLPLGPFLLVRNLGFCCPGE